MILKVSYTMNPLNINTPTQEMENDAIELLNKNTFKRLPTIIRINPVVSIPPINEKSRFDVNVYSVNPKKIIPVNSSALVTVAPV